MGSWQTTSSDDDQIARKSSHDKATAVLGSGADSSRIAFRMGEIVALSRDEEQWSLQWMVVPDILPDVP